MSQEAYKTIVDYYKEVVILLEGQLLTSYINKEGKDISDLLRGKLLAVKDILQLEEYIDFNEKLRKEKKDE